MELSKAQKEIVDSTSKKIIVDAGSGSGKTRVLTERVRKILNSRTDPRSVVVITFTNMAANELKERLSEIKGSEQCFIGTIHSYANSLLKDSGLDYEIFSEEYQTMFMKQLIEKYGYYSTFSDYELFLKCDKQVAAGRMSKNEVRQKFSDYKVYDDDKVGVTSINYLALDVMKAAGIKYPGYFQVIDSIRSEVPQINTAGYYSMSQKKFFQVEDVKDPKDQKAIKLYRYIQYNTTIDKKDNEFRRSVYTVVKKNG